MLSSPNASIARSTQRVPLRVEQGQQGERRQGQDQPGGFRIGVGGVAYGGHARKTVGLALDRLPGDEGAGGRVEDHPDVLSAALEEAFLLVAGLKPR